MLLQTILSSEVRVFIAENHVFLRNNRLSLRAHVYIWSIVQWITRYTKIKIQYLIGGSVLAY